MRLSIAIPPGLRRDGTEGQSRGRWMEASLVRSYGGDVGPILGWRKRSEEAVDGKARALIAWRTAGAERRIAIGTELGLFVQTAAGAVHDISPVDFVPGVADATVDTGYGAGPYDDSTYGTPRIDTGAPIAATTWSLDTWGQYLIGCATSDGRIVEWQNSTGTPAAVVTNAPTDCIGSFTTQDRFTVAAGASGNRRLMAWSDRGNNTVWTPSSTNLAGDMELDTSGAYVTSVELRGLTLILTDLDAHAMQYVGLPSVYLFNRIGDGCGAVSAGCIATQGDYAMWWSSGTFMRFDGALTPVDCPIRDLFTGMNSAQKTKIVAYHNASQNEFVWHYPSAASLENDRYVSFNYLTGAWYEGELARLSGIAPGVFAQPLLMSSDGYVYEHEVGAEYDGATPYARSGPIKLGDGELSMRVTGGEFDVIGTPSIKFYNRDRPTSPETETAETVLAPGLTDFRYSARQTEIEVLFSAPTDRFGKGELLASPAGRR